MRLSLFVLLLQPGMALGQIQPIQLEGFIVTGTPVPRSVGTESSHVTILEGKELRARGFSYLGEALSEAAGVVLVRSGSQGAVTSVFLRGAESDQVKVLVDGVELNLAGGGIDLGGLLVEDVERIEIVRGPASALYGSGAMAGVIQIFTRRGQRGLEAEGMVRAGTHGRLAWSGHVGGARGPVGYAVTLSRASSDGVLPLNNRSATTSLSGTVRLRADDQTWIELVGRHSDHTYHFPTDGGGAIVDENSFTFGKALTAGLGVRRSFGEALGLAASVQGYWRDGGTDDRPDGPADTLGFFAFRSQDAFRRGTASVQATLRPWPGFSMAGGVEWREERQRSFSESQSEFGPSVGRDRFRRRNLGVYAHLVLERDSWAGHAGIRVEDNQQYGRFLTYQAGGSVRLSSSGLRLRGSMGRGMKEPTFLEAFATGFVTGNPDLRPEESFSWELGLDQPLGAQGGHLTLTGFEQTLEDLIQYTFIPLTPGGPNFYNVARAGVAGVEAALEAQAGSVELRADYTYLHTRVEDAGFDAGEGAVFVEGEELIRRPRHSAAVSFRVPLPPASLRGRVRWVGPRSDRDFSSFPATPVRLPAYVELSLGCEVGLFEAEGGRRSVGLRVDAENLFGERYQEVYGFDAPGRVLLVGIRLSGLR